MSEEEQQKPLNSELNQTTPIIPRVDGPADIKRKNLRGTLENLPDDIKKDMEEYMRKVNVHATKKYMAEKYGEKYPNIKEISYPSFKQYYKRHKVEIAKELELQKQSAPPPAEIMDVINAITNPNISLDDKRNALTSLFNSCKARSELLEQRQTHFIDPQMEALILANRKEQRIIIEKIATLGEQLSKESDKDWLGEAESLVQVVLSSVYNSYRLVNSNNNFSLFSATLEQNLTAILKNYKQEKEKLNKPT